MRIFISYAYNHFVCIYSFRMSIIISYAYNHFVCIYSFRVRIIISYACTHSSCVRMRIFISYAYNHLVCVYSFFMRSSKVVCFKHYLNVGRCNSLLFHSKHNINSLSYAYETERNLPDTRLT